MGTTAGSFAMGRLLTSSRYAELTQAVTQACDPDVMRRLMDNSQLFGRLDVVFVLNSTVAIKGAQQTSSILANNCGMFSTVYVTS